VFDAGIGDEEATVSAEARLCGLSEFICKRPVKDTLWYFSIHTYHVYQNSKDVYTDVISWRRWNHCFFNLDISDFISSGLDCVSFDCCWSSTSTSRHVGGELIFSVGSSSSKAARRFKNCIAWLVACLLIFMMLHLLFHPKKRSGAATVALSTTDSVSCWAQSLTGSQTAFTTHNGAKRLSQGYPTWISTQLAQLAGYMGSIGLLSAFAMGHLQAIRFNRSSYPACLKLQYIVCTNTSFLVHQKEGLSICNNSIQEWTYSLYLFIVNVSQHLLFAQIWQILSFVLNSLSFRRRTPLLTVYGKQSWRRLGRRPERPDFFK